ncbi:type II secretion system F family protein [Terrihalobacillus insolitus]|uniref:type II secretion system F family protein n=1 Tax=Terrihalobacillus insolitus TaxID=2950438 RepID=UPI002341F049|nr:type II secretion system F family protein [Terrihalobacillus insolitus]MDC3413643.1 type II secretion system F family protein [Terrihalobacillus insolitus]
MKTFVIVMVFFSASFLFWSMLKLFFFKDKRIQQRKERYFTKTNNETAQNKQKPRLSIDLNLTKQNVRKLLTKDKNEKLALMIHRAGVPLKPEEYIMFQWIATFLGAGISYLIIGNILLFPIGAIIGFNIPKLLLHKKQKERLEKFNDGLPEMITTIVGALRAGFSFPQALKSVVEEAQSPIKEEIETVLREMQYGTNVEDALKRLNDRMPSDDLDIMIQAIIIQRQVGGNLATVLETIITTIRDRIKIQGQISTLTAQGRLSGVIIGLLPVLLGLFLYLIEPEYIGVLFTHPIGIVLVVIASISSIIGFLLIRKLTTIEV